MRKLLITIVSVLFLSHSIYCDDTDTAKLIQELPTSYELNQAKKLLANPADFSRYEDKSTRLSNDGKKRLLSKAKNDIQKAKLIIPQLKGIIKVGKSIFNYPGLITKGRISYDSDTEEYRLYIGVYLLDHEGKEPYDLNIVFASNGIIKSVKNVIWKR